MGTKNKPLVVIGADHGGFKLKELLKTRLLGNGYQVVDCGADEYVEQDDYPQIAICVAEKVLEARKKSELAFGLLLCRSSGGMTIVANKVRGIRAVSIDSVETAKHAREHNDAHIASISGDWIVPSVAMESVEVFLQTPFSKEPRHERRLRQITEYEESA